MPEKQQPLSHFFKKAASSRWHETTSPSNQSQTDPSREFPQKREYAGGNVVDVYENGVLTIVIEPEEIRCGKLIAQPPTTLIHRNLEGADLFTVIRDDKSRSTRHMLFTGDQLNIYECSAEDESDEIVIDLLHGVVLRKSTMEAMEPDVEAFLLPCVDFENLDRLHMTAAQISTNRHSYSFSALQNFTDPIAYLNLREPVQTNRETVD